MKVTRSKQRNRRNNYSYDLNNYGKHLLLENDEEGYFHVILYYDDPKVDIYQDEFEIKKEDNGIIYSMFNRLYENCHNSSFYRFNDDEVLFDSFGSTVSLRKEEDKVILDFTKDYGRISNMCDAPLINNCYENEEFERLFTELQMYDPNYHQISMDEYIKVLKKTK